MNIFSKIILLFVLVFVFAIAGFQNQALMSEDLTPEQRREAREVLKQELKRLEQKIAQYDKDIAKTEKEKKTLQGEIRALRNRISRLDLQIRQGNIMIEGIESQIGDTEDSIIRTSLEIKNSKQGLANILQVIHKKNQKSLIEILFLEAKLSDFFSHLVALETLNLENQEILSHIINLEKYLENQKHALNTEKQELEGVVAIRILQKQEGASAKRGQERLLRMTKTEHQRYLRAKEEKAKKAAEIRARIIELVGIPDAAQLSFGELLSLAKLVEGQTGIRPAFLLAIITQESALGRNVGQCSLSTEGIKTGEGVCIRTGKRAIRTMNPRRDVPHFLNITRELGIDTFRTPVSCVMWRRERPVGWGGAMGPAQFIPSTWVNRRHILEPFVQGTPNPWNVNHAFLASALYLRDLGGQTNERRAALQYFAGENWANPRFAFYGDQVVRRINCLQTFIDHQTITSFCEQLIFIPK